MTMYFLNDIRVNINLSDGTLSISNLKNDLLVSVKQRLILKVEAVNTSLEIHYVIKRKNNTMKVNSVFIHGSTEDIAKIKDDIASNIKDRPKSVLVIINPHSGRKRGIKIYQKVASPLFKLCDVKTDVIVTKKQREPMEILQNYNLSQIDGIVTVGGDGLYCECMNGLMSRVQRDNDVDRHNQKARIVPASLPIGIIPAGSGDVIVQYLHGTRCARTAVLHILLGGKVDSNIVSVHEGGQLLSYSALILGFGLFGDMMYDCERFRWLGPARYNIIPVGCMLKRRAFDVEVEYHSLKKGEEPKRTRLYGRQISLPNTVLRHSSRTRYQRTKSTSDVQKQNFVVEECIKEEEHVYAVDSHPIMMKEKAGMMTPHFSQESLMVYTTHKCTFSDHVAQLTKVKNKNVDCYDYKFVSKHEVSGYKVRIMEGKSFNSGKNAVLQKDYYINCDGEVIKLQKPEFNVKLHRKVVKFFGDITD